MYLCVYNYVRTYVAYSHMFMYVSTCTYKHSHCVGVVSIPALKNTLRYSHKQAYISHVRIYIQTHVHTYMDTYKYTYICMLHTEHSCTGHIYIITKYIYTHSCVSHTCTYMQTYQHTCRLHTCAHIYIHARINTYTMCRLIINVEITNIMMYKDMHLIVSHTHVHLYVHTHINTYVRTCTHIHIYTHTYIHTYIYTYIHTYIHICTYINIHTYLQKYIRAHTYTYMH